MTGSPWAKAAAVVIAYLTFTDPLRIQPRSQDRRNQIQVDMADLN